MPTTLTERPSLRDPLQIAASGTLLADAPECSAVAARFEGVYQDAGGDALRIPWHRDGANPPLVSWLNAEAPSLVRPGASAVVVGCGLGDDVCELASRGYDVLGFDVSASAVDWCKRRHPDLVDRFAQADLLNLPSRLRRRFDLVVEVYTVQSLPVTLRDAAVAGAVSLLRPHGTLLVTCRGRNEADALDESGEPPYPLTARELIGLMARHGLTPTRSVDDFYDDETPPKHRLRGAFRRI
jgi:hypothetical protein